MFSILNSSPLVHFWTEWMQFSNCFPSWLKILLIEITSLQVSKCARFIYDPCSTAPDIFITVDYYLENAFFGLVRLCFLPCFLLPISYSSDSCTGYYSWGHLGTWLPPFSVLNPISVPSEGTHAVSNSSGGYVPCFIPNTCQTLDYVPYVRCALMFCILELPGDLWKIPSSRLYPRPIKSQSLHRQEALSDSQEQIGLGTTALYASSNF